jgi:SAM-dependent methyltransferase
MESEDVTALRQDDGSSTEIHRIQAFYAEFDRGRHEIVDLERVSYADRYLVEDCQRRLDVLLAEKLEMSLAKCRVLDLGCGFGSLLAWFHEQGVPAEQLVGVDLLPHRIALAEKRYPALTFMTGNAEHLCLPRHSFDLVLAFTVFSSILDKAMAHNVARNVRDLLSPGGAVVWYDTRYPNPWNPNIKGMTISRIRDLFPSFQLDLEATTLIPQLSRRLRSRINVVYPLLASVPFLRSHYLGLLRCPK